MTEEFEQPQFIEDGHKISFVLTRDNIEIADIVCPNVGRTSLCNRRRAFCVVQRFIDAFGIDLNLGRSMLDGAIEIAWCPIYGDESDLDSEYNCIWFTPVSDPDYRLMMEESRAESPGFVEDFPMLEPPKDSDGPSEEGEEGQ